MTMDMNMSLQHRGGGGGLRVDAAAVVLTSSNNTASPATSDSSDRTGSPVGSPSSSPSLPLNNNNNNNEKMSSTTITPKNSIKRSFDVAFLMAPDDLSTIKKRHQQQEQQLRLVTTASLMMRSAMTPLNVSVTPPQPAEPAHQQQQALSRQILQQHPPSLMIGPHADVSLYRRLEQLEQLEDAVGAHEDASAAVRSAFTKVTSSQGLLLMQNPGLPTSPSSVSSLSGGLSPDHSTYQNSLSPPPPSASTPTPTHSAAPAPASASPPYSHPLHYQGPVPPGPGPAMPYGAPPFYVPQSQATPPQQQASPPPQAQPQGPPQDKPQDRKVQRRYSPPATNGAFPFGAYSKSGAPHGADLMAGFQKLRPGAPPGMLYPNSLAAYTNLAAAAAAAYPFGGPSFGPGPQGSAPPAAPNPGSALAAAAVVSASLLPPTFAALSLPAQNVCAKCNVSFRMTSDLVYHMRAHHKSDHTVNDPSRRRREQDKLKCPVCAESFRERHHLTRHMTAHQDKEGDSTEDPEVTETVGISPEKSPSAISRRRNVSNAATSIMAGGSGK